MFLRAATALTSGIRSQHICLELQQLQRVICLERSMRVTAPQLYLAILQRVHHSMCMIIRCESKCTLLLVVIGYYSTAASNTV